VIKLVQALGILMEYKENGWQVQKMQCLGCIIETHSGTIVKHSYCQRYNKLPPLRKSIHEWLRQFEETCLWGGIWAGPVLVMKLLQALKGDDKVKCLTFYNDFLDVNENDRNFIMSLVMRPLPLLWIDNWHNVRIWGNQNSHASIQHILDSAKTNLFHAMHICLCRTNCYRIAYLHMLENWLISQRFWMKVCFSTGRFFAPLP
jgi:hypothetical protein